MGLDQPVLQWLSYVVEITGFTSLVVFCYALKQENKRLTLELAHGQLRQKHSEMAMAQSAVSGSMQGHNKEPKAPPLDHQDIRHFVARRSPDWLAAARS